VRAALRNEGVKMVEEPEALEITIEIDTERCIGCFECIELCPQCRETEFPVFGKGDKGPKVENPDSCIKCLSCEVNCRAVAIRVNYEARAVPAETKAEGKNRAIF
jgi:NAD-dependent dihydropyrimidine dehydrogenase PreA subunit